MKKLVLSLVFIMCSSFAFAQSDDQENEQLSACPVTKKEAYIIHLKYEEKKCQLTEKQNKYILKVRKAENIEDIYQYTRRLNSEVGIFDEEID